MKIGNYESAIKVINYALSDDKITALERKTITDNLEVINVIIIGM